MEGEIEGSSSRSSAWGRRAHLIGQIKQHNNHRRWDQLMLVGAVNLQRWGREEGRGGESPTHQKGIQALSGYNGYLDVLATDVDGVILHLLQ